MRKLASLLAGIVAWPLFMTAAVNAQTTTPPTAEPPPSPAQKPAATAPATGKPSEKTAKRDAKPAKVLFGAQKSAAGMKPQAIGFYAKGCLAGGEQLPVDGDAWQAMRLSRNRNWGHPNLISLLKRFAGDVQKHDGWPGLLVGDLAQPRGGPMLTGHRSHQIGLDADIWLTPMPKRRLTREEREKMSAVSMLAPGGLAVDPERWTKTHVKIIKRMASYGEVQRVLVHPAIKKALCEGADELGKDRAWLNKVRPYWGHFYHFHVRIACPQGSPGCKPQPEVPDSDTCGAELDHWYKILSRPAKPKPVEPAPKIKPKPKPRREMTLAELPSDCRIVLDAPDRKSEILNVPAPARAIRPTKQ